MKLQFTLGWWRDVTTYPSVKDSKQSIDLAFMLSIAMLQVTLSLTMFSSTAFTVDANSAIGLWNHHLSDSSFTGKSRKPRVIIHSSLKYLLLQA